MTGDDRDLGDVFAALRREEEAGAPPISGFRLAARGMTGREDACRRAWPGGLMAAVVSLAALIAVMVAGGVWLLQHARVPAQGTNWQPSAASGTASVASSSTVSITAWKPATSFLLNTPGSELLERVPEVGEWRAPGMTPAPGAGSAADLSNRHRRFRKRDLL
jgi:hypothetical protein